MRWIGLAGLIAMTVAGCAALPADGPPNPAVSNSEGQVPKPPYVLVKIDEKVTNITGQYRPDGFSSMFKIGSATRRPQINLAPGDKLNINIFEAGADGLFSSAEAKATQITAEVGANGQVFVPYVGPLLAEGRSPEALRGSIENALADKAIQPQVQVSVAESISNSVTVLGDVKAPGRKRVPVGGTRVLDAVAEAGGTESKPYETKIVLRRGRETASADMEDLIDDPAENVLVEPGDVIFVGDATRSFTVFGAAKAPAEYKFEARRVTLGEGLAKAGGLNGEVADAKSVFVFRFEPAVIAKALNERAVTAPDGTMVPVIYRLNFADPKGLFLAQLFELRDEDMIFIATNGLAELNKFLKLLDPILDPAARIGQALIVQSIND